MAAQLPAFAAPSGTSLVRASSIVRASAPVAVRVTSWTEAACVAGVAETRRHVRSVAAFGVFDVGTTAPQPWREGDRGCWLAIVRGETWRASGEEYTAGALIAAVERASPGSRCEVFEDAGARTDFARAALDQADTRGAGSSAGAIVEAGASAGAAAGSLLEGAGAAAQGLGDAAAGAGAGAGALGGFLRDWPVLALVVVIAVVVSVRRGVL